MSKDMFLIVGANCWGKGWSFSEALANMLENESSMYPTKTLQMRRFCVHDEDSLGMLQMDEMGGCQFPKRWQMSKLDIPMIDAVRKARTAFIDAIDEHLYSRLDFDSFMYNDTDKVEIPPADNATSGNLT